jgi:outer membrane protein assembly factor BamB
MKSNTCILSCKFPVDKRAVKGEGLVANDLKYESIKDFAANTQAPLVEVKAVDQEKLEVRVLMFKEVLANWVTTGAGPVMKTGGYELGATTAAMRNKILPQILPATMQRSCVHEGKGTVLTGQLKWSYATGGWVRSSCSADIDGDGEIEVIVPSEDYKVYCLRGIDGTLKWSYATGDYVQHAVICDVDGDGKMEVIVGSKDCYVYCIACNGTLKWKYQASDWVHDCLPLAYDVDGDGKIEIIVAPYDGKAYCLNPDGTLKWCSTISTPPDLAFGLAVADIDKDGAAEILIAHCSCYAICLKPDGTLKWKYYVESGCMAVGLSDVDGDGKLEVLCNATAIFTLYCLNHDGTFKWKYVTGDCVDSCIFGACDIDGDGVVECLEGSLDWYMYCLKGTDGTLKWRYLTGDEVETGGCMGDIDSDGKYEVVFGSCDHCVYCLEPDGSLKWKYPTGLYVAYYGSVHIDDVDGDGKLEVLAGSCDSKLYCFRSE